MGLVAFGEMKQVLQTLDKDLWTDQRVEAVLATNDKNGDGAFQFTEFWSWICGHGGGDTSDFKPTLLNQAVADNKKRAEDAQVRLASKERKKEEQAALEADRERKAKERAEGKRFNRKDFI